MHSEYVGIDTNDISGELKYNTFDRLFIYCLFRKIKLQNFILFPVTDLLTLKLLNIEMIIFISFAEREQTSRI